MASNMSPNYKENIHIIFPIYKFRMSCVLYAGIVDVSPYSSTALFIVDVVVVVSLCVCVFYVFLLAGSAPRICSSWQILVSYFLDDRQYFRRIFSIDFPFAWSIPTPPFPFLCFYTALFHSPNEAWMLKIKCM